VYRRREPEPEQPADARQVRAKRDARQALAVATLVDHYVAQENPRHERSGEAGGPP
jgi:hypothetical protein